MEVHFAGTLDEATLRRATIAQLKGLRLFGIALLAMAAAGSMALPVAFVALAAVAGALLCVAPDLAARRIAKTSALLRTPTAGFASDSGFNVTTARGQVQRSWSDLHQTKELPDAVVLYESSLRSHILQRDFFRTTEEWDAFLALTRAHNRRPHRSATLSSRQIAMLALALAILLLILLAWSFTGT
jgi:YcxB-like protein